MLALRRMFHPAGSCMRQRPGTPMPRKRKTPSTRGSTLICRLTLLEGGGSCKLSAEIFCLGDAKRLLKCSGPFFLRWVSISCEYTGQLAYDTRENCQCSECMHPDTRQRIVDTFSVWMPLYSLLWNHAAHFTRYPEISAQRRLPMARKMPKFNVCPS